MTNGEKIKEIFPNGVLTSINNSYYWGDDILVSKNWWNAEYKKPTTPNNLGVDAISRQAVLDLINADWKYENLEIEINNLPSVTPQEPILDKIRAEIEQLKLHKAKFLTSDNKVCIDSQEVLNVIDKYKGESEG